MCASLTKTGKERPQLHQKKIATKRLRRSQKKWKTEETTRALEESRHSFYTYYERFIQGLACLSIIHPSLKVSPWSSQASPVENLRRKLEKLEEQNELGLQERADILSPLGLYGGNQKMKLPLLHNTRIHTSDGHIGKSHRSTIKQMPNNHTLRSLDANLAIPTRVLCFKVSESPQRTPVRPVLLTS
jgi:hypothetical protein